MTFPHLALEGTSIMFSLGEPTNSVSCCLEKRKTKQVSEDKTASDVSSFLRLYIDTSFEWTFS